MVFLFFLFRIYLRLRDNYYTTKAERWQGYNIINSPLRKLSTYPPLTDYACIALICVLREFAWGYVLSLLCGVLKK